MKEHGRGSKSIHPLILLFILFGCGQYHALGCFNPEELDLVPGNGLKVLEERKIF
jgi:hypothetical protein